MSKETGGPAFPADRLYKNQWQDGMTLRDYFAAKAMQGMMANNWNKNYAAWSEQAYELADEMLKAREQ